jgi:hypothetical protein
MNQWFGPLWNADNRHKIWQVGSEWSANLQDRVMNIQGDAARTLALYDRERKEKLSPDEYAWLAERGLIRMMDEDRAEWQIVILETKELRDELLAIGSRIREKYAEEFRKLRDPYVKAVLGDLPAHMRKIKEFETQFIFFSDGRFVFHCVKNLVNSGKLKVPEEVQKKALSTLMMPA